LQATELAQPDPTSVDPPTSEPPVAETQEPFIPPPPVRAASSDPPPPPPQPPEPPRHERNEPPAGRRVLAFLPEELSWAHASAGIGGAVGALLLLLLSWLIGAFSSSRTPSNDLGPRLASIEAQLRELAARPAPPSVDPKAVEDIAARLARLESAQATPRAPVTDPVVLGRLSSTENAVKSLADNIAGLSRREDGIEAALSRRSDAIESAQRETRGQVDKLAGSLSELQTTARAAAAGSDRAVRLAVSAAALREAVERGTPFAAELAVVKPLATDPAALSALEPFSATGVPSSAALAQELTALLPPMLRAGGEPAHDSGFLERLQAHAEKLVRIRPVDEASGDDHAAILARVEQRARQANIPGALSEIAKLPPGARAPLQAWVAKAQARGKAIESSQRIATDAVTALKAAP
jgi:hypothetical protein